MSPTPMYPHPQEPQRSGLLTALVAGAVIALVAANIYLYVQIDHVRTDVVKTREDLMNQVSNLRDTSSAHARSGLATMPFQSLSNVASGPMTVMPSTRLPPESNTGAQKALIPGMGCPMVRESPWRRVSMMASST